MSFVHIIMEPRDEETKFRISREVSDAVAEGTNDPIDAVTVIFHEVPRQGYARGLSYAPKRPSPATPDGGRPEYVIVNHSRVEDEAAYVALRSELVNPSLANAEGFVSTQLIRLSGTDHEYMVLTKWMSKAHCDAWITNDTHRSLEAVADQRVPRRQVLEMWEGEFVHQTFGTLGGMVLDGLDSAAHPATYISTPAG